MHAKDSIHHPPLKKILVVDDEATIRDMMIDILDLEGYTVEVARNGQEALTKIRQAGLRSGYLVFLDIMMPVMDGYEFYRQLSADHALRQRHVVVMMSALDHLAQAKTLEIDKILPKPFVMDDVIQIIQTYME
ncbi:response regulator [Dictyobacter arantiisoli]|uniref:Response regulatory domain-containing protein n=1 Tax=Dictyobacter arantiisoli TaxID=2014874 RepID=A0A5A5THE9_9CHLR|nr:response regulator [Dictyobacter arantiisoli]GCF10742.1 hypothetical protein KDI_43060 [Dictyobacter arantiisoli]